MRGEGRREGGIGTHRTAEGWYVPVCVGIRKGGVVVCWHIKI